MGRRDATSLDSGRGWRGGMQLVMTGVGWGDGMLLF